MLPPTTSTGNHWIPNSRTDAAAAPHLCHKSQFRNTFFVVFFALSKPRPRAQYVLATLQQSLVSLPHFIQVNSKQRQHLRALLLPHALFVLRPLGLRWRQRSCAFFAGGSGHIRLRIRQFVSPPHAIQHPHHYFNASAPDILSIYDQLPGLVGPNGMQPLTSAAGGRGGPVLNLISSALRAPLDVTLEMMCAAGALVSSAVAFTGIVNGLLFLFMFAAFHGAQAAFGTFTSFQVPTSLLCRCV
jgi:hypothetical protein